MCCRLNIRRGSVCPNLRHFPQKDQDQENIVTLQVLSMYGHWMKKKQKIVVDYYRHRRMPCPDQAFGVFSVDVFLQAR